MKNEKIVVALVGRRREAMCRANVPTPLTKSPNLSAVLSGKNARAAFWSSPFAFFVDSELQVNRRRAGA
jgi:hypothetical protein